MLLKTCTWLLSSGLEYCKHCISLHLHVRGCFCLAPLGTRPDAGVALLRESHRYTDAAWSATLPWDWVEDGVEITVAVRTASGGRVIGHRLALEGLPAFDVHTVQRIKLAIFGSEEDFAGQ